MLIIQPYLAIDKHEILIIKYYFINFRLIFVFKIPYTLHYVNHFLCVFFVKYAYFHISSKFSYLNNPPTLVTIHFIYAEQHSRFLEFYASLSIFLHSRLTSFRKKHIMKMIYITPRYSYERNRYQRTSSFGNSRSS